MSRPRRSTAADSTWLSPSQLRAWVAYMRVQLRMNYEINRQLQRVVEPGKFNVMIGHSSADIRLTGSFEVVD